MSWVRKGLLAGVVVKLALGIWLFGPTPPVADTAATPSVTAGETAQTSVERGRYLATVGNCQGCHTPLGGPAWAGGVPITTPFGTVYGSNLTPAPLGLGGWTSSDFWRALHHGQSKDGRLLNPAFPYPNTTHISRADSDALWAFFQSIPPVNTPTPPNQMRWPFNTQAALKVWRALYFRPAPVVQEAPTSGVLRGAYLVQGLAHCSACHTSRNAWGGGRDLLGLAGGLMPGQGGYAPSLLDPNSGGVQRWSEADTVAFFQTGRNAHASASGAMAEVVLHSTQHWQAPDLKAMAAYLRSLPNTPASAPPGGPLAQGAVGETGAKLYRQHCAECHGDQGEGARLTNGQWAYPPLAGNRALDAVSPANVVKTILYGGFGAATAGHPQPFGMPPFVQVLSDSDVAAVATHLRTQWGHQAGSVSPIEVMQWRAGTRP